MFCFSLRGSKVFITRFDAWFLSSRSKYRVRLSISRVPQNHFGTQLLKIAMRHLFVLFLFACIRSRDWNTMFGCLSFSQKSSMFSRVEFSKFQRLSAMFCFSLRRSEDSLNLSNVKSSLLSLTIPSPYFLLPKSSKSYNLFWNRSAIVQKACMEDACSVSLWLENFPLVIGCSPLHSKYS